MKIQEIIKMLENSRDELSESRAMIAAAANNNPFGKSINLEEETQKVMDSMDKRVAVYIHQSKKIGTITEILEELYKRCPSKEEAAEKAKTIVQAVLDEKSISREEVGESLANMVAKRTERVGDIIFPDESLTVNCAYDVLDVYGVLTLLEEPEILPACLYLSEYAEYNT